MQKIKIKKKTKIPRVTDERWNSQKQLSGLVEQKKKEKKRKEKTLNPKLSQGFVPYISFLQSTHRKMVY